jgi:hypothetical protein
MVPVMLVFLRSVVVAAAVLALSGCASALQQIANNLAPEIFDTPEYEADESEYERSEAALTSPAASAPASDAASRFSQRVYKWGTTYDDYPLDSTERRECLEAVMVTYEGETLPYSGPVRVVTGSRSESGVEPIVQGESITPSWPVSAGACAVWLRVERRD